MSGEVVTARGRRYLVERWSTPGDSVRCPSCGAAWCYCDTEVGRATGRAVDEALNGESPVDP